MPAAEPNQQSLPAAATASGIVKQVLSGDTAIIRGQPVNGPPPEKLLTFAFISSPRFGRKGGQADEPFAFEAREFLRKLLVGKQVRFRIDYVTAASGKEYGTVFVVPNESSGVPPIDVTEALVAAGWAQVKPRQNMDDACVEYVGRLQQLETEARSKQLGIFASSGTVEPKVINHNFDQDAREFLNKHKKSQLDGIIEQVRDGSTVRVLLLDYMQVITLSFGGIKAPVYLKDVPGLEDLIEPFSEEAKFFVESRLLQRQVKVAFEGVASNNQSFIGTLLHPAGNISEALLANGLAQIVDWSISTVTGGPEKYREAEKLAKSKKLRIWKNYEPKTLPKNVREPEFEGTVVRIISGDTIMVESLQTGIERKITFSSIRQAKPKDEAYYNQEAKEFLRSRLIGNKVHVSVEYIRPASEGFEERTCATVMLGAINIAEALVNKGLAGVIRHRKDDDDRSKYYDNLLIAEDKAQKGKKGIFSDKEPPSVRINDASENANKAKSFLPFFKRAGRVPAIVEYVVSASRFRVYIPKELAKATFVLAGIRAPKSARTEGDKSEPFGQEAHDFANKKTLQRDVEIEVEGIDKSGGFIGTLWLKTNENFAVSLLQEGYASIHDFSADKSPYSAQLYAAEKQARNQKKNIWTIEREVEQPVVAQEEKEPSVEPVNLVVTEVISGGHCYIQILNDQDTATAVIPVQPRVGNMISAQFTEDNVWYRARVKSVNNTEKKAEVFYVDYGNSEVLPFNRLRTLSAKFTSFPAQAQEAYLSFIKCPELEDDYGVESTDFFKEILRQKESFKANIDYRVGNTVYCTLYLSATPSVEKSINAEMLKNGFAQLDFKIARRLGKSFEYLKSIQDEAKRGRLGMFEYGDFDFTEKDEL